MKKYKVKVSPTAQRQYLSIREYLIEEWPKSVLEKFENLTEEKINQVAEFPKSCLGSKKKKGVYKAVIEEHNSFYYRIKRNTIEIMIFVDNRMDPEFSKKQLKKYGR